MPPRVNHLMRRGVLLLASQIAIPTPYCPEPMPDQYPILTHEELRERRKRSIQALRERFPSPIVPEVPKPAKLTVWQKLTDWRTTLKMYWKWL